MIARIPIRMDAKASPEAVLASMPITRQRRNRSESVHKWQQQCHAGHPPMPGRTPTMRPTKISYRQEVNAELSAVHLTPATSLP